MADYRLRPGDYRPDVGGPLGAVDPMRSTAGNPDVASARYEGPHGPLDVYSVEGLTVTEVRGAGLTAATLAWGPKAGGGDGQARLRQGLPCQVDGVRLIVSQPRGGLTRSRRQVVAEGDGRRYAVRVRGAPGRLAVERGGGGVLARFPTVASGGRGCMADDGDLVDVVVVVLLQASGLADEAAVGWLP